MVISSADVGKAATDLLRRGALGRLGGRGGAGNGAVGWKIVQKSLWGFPQMGDPQTCWFRMENPIRMETPLWFLVGMSPHQWIFHQWGYSIVMV